MSLRETAAADFRAIVGDAAGFGWPVTVKPPDGRVLELVGLSTDVSEMIDPQTGIAISGRTASVTLSTKAFEDAGFPIPRGVAEESGKPWIVTFNDIGGKPHTFKISEAKPDRAIGSVVCMLEVYKR